MSQNSDKPVDPTQQNPQSDESAANSPGNTPEGVPAFGQRAETPPDGTTAPAGNENDEPLDPIVELNMQVEDLTERLLVAHADIQNLHKRLERERSETAKFAIAKFAGDTVAVADNFERAIESVPEGATDGNPVLKALLDGVTMTEREFLNVLDRHGVHRVTPFGKIFDPHKHQAVMQEEDASVEAGTILKVFQPGYVIEDRVLRPAMVVVAKGGPKPLKDTDDTDEPEDSTPSPEDDTPDA